MSTEENSIMVAGNRVQVKRILIPTSDVRIDLQNPRIKFKIKKVDRVLNNQELVEILKEDSDVRKLFTNIRDNRGLHEPILVTRNNRIIEGNCRAAAYIWLFQGDKKPESPWAKIPAIQITDELSEKQIAILQGYYHVVGKNKWKKYEKAGHIHYMSTVLGMSSETIQKQLGLHQKTIVILLSAYNAMNRHYLPKYGQKETDPLNKFSYFEEFYKRDELKAFREKQRNVERFSEWVSDTNMFPEGRDVRLLGEILKHSEVREVFEQNGMVEAKRALDQYDPTLGSNLFKLVQKTTGELKKLRAQEAEFIRKDGKKKELLRDLISIAEQVIKSHK